MFLKNRNIISKIKRSKVTDYAALNLLCSFCSVKLMLISIKYQHLYFSWLCILGIRLRFWTSVIHVGQCSKIPLIRLCYTLSWRRHQNVFTLVQLGYKGNAWSSCFHTLIVMILCFLNNIMQDLRKCYTFPWPHSAMTWGYDLRHFWPSNHLKLAKHVFL